MFAAATVNSNPAEWSNSARRGDAEARISFIGLDNIVEMRPIQTFAGSVLAEIVRRQPASPARTAFAWQLTVGPALARATSVEMEGTTLRVRANDERWLKEIARAKPMILPRLQELLGDQNLTKINVVGPTLEPV